MFRNITHEIRTLYDSFNHGVYSVQEFQFRLEPLLGSYSAVSRETEEAFRRTINDLERILYTIPVGEQRVHAKRVALNLLDLIDKEGL